MLLINLQDILGLMKWLLVDVPLAPYSPLTSLLRYLQMAPSPSAFTAAVGHDP